MKAQAARQADDGHHDGPVFRVIGEVAHKRLVDLELVDRKPLEVTERRVARAKVVNRQAHAALVQVFHDLDGAQRVLHGHALGQLQFQVMRRQTSLGQHLGHQLGQVLVTELHGRQVDGHLLQRQARLQPDAHLLRRGAQHPFTNRQDQTTFFGHRNELGRRHRAQHRVLPAQQGLHADQLVVVQRYLGLVDQMQLL